MQSNGLPDKRTVPNGPPWYTRPWLVFGLGFVSAALGAASLYLPVPAFHAKEWTPVTAFTGILTLSGLGLMFISALVFGEKTIRERETAFRLGLLVVIAFAALTAIFNSLDIPFGTIIAFLLAAPGALALQRLCAWLGQEL